LCVAALTPILSSCATPNVTPLELKVAESVESALLAKVKPNVVKHPIAAISTTTAIDSKGNFGRLSISKTEERLSLQPNGLYNTAISHSMNTAAGDRTASAAQSQTACRFIPVIYESSVEVNSTNTTAVPVGGVFLPFGFTSQWKTWDRSRLLGFTSDANPCAPKPGQRFTMSVESERQTVRRGTLMNRDDQRTYTVTTSCVVSDASLASNSLHSSLRGTYLQVDCKSEGSNFDPAEIRYAFLEDSGLYLALQIVRKYQTDKVMIDSVTYLKP
jgi:hypothetical protein